jgi:hypothetical protein
LGGVSTRIILVPSVSEYEHTTRESRILDERPGLSSLASVLAFICTLCFVHENQPKTLVFISNPARRHWYQLVLEQIRFGRLVFSKNMHSGRIDLIFSSKREYWFGVF